MKIWFDKNNLYLIADIKQNLNIFSPEMRDFFCVHHLLFACLSCPTFPLYIFPILITCVTLLVQAACIIHASLCLIKQFRLSATGQWGKTIPSGTRLFLDQNHISNNTASLLRVMNKSRTDRHNKKQFKWLWCYCRVYRFVSLICLNVKSYICLSMSVCCSLRRLQWGLFQRCG